MPVTRRVALLTSIALGAVTIVALQPAEARSKHRRLQAIERPVPYKKLPIPYSYSYYPEEVEDGVSGNLPFNNQIRKFKDPLNANGGR